MSVERGIRKCAFMNRPIAPHDKSSVVYTVGVLNESGRYTGRDVILSVSGQVRKSGEADKLLYAKADDLIN
ncbi:small subunit ribosomal protein S21e [Nematocida minor]|uniref:small subunit ribosomal protein S21e n=1 Tax=Nematocida minor TaxID=1912983 RepID=UPI0022209B17|nr:small subunit ribosomal protein S21e [Nematocida minor]KAI5189820.1 small subunit ribosomal protein S21e [Nematocida minor]